MALLLFNGSWTMFCRALIEGMYILMILLLVPPEIGRRNYCLNTTVTCAPCWIDYGGRIGLLHLLKPISLYVRLCLKMAHVGRRQGKWLHLTVGQNQMMIVSPREVWKEGRPNVEYFGR